MTPGESRGRFHTQCCGRCEEPMEHDAGDNSSGIAKGRCGWTRCQSHGTLDFTAVQTDGRTELGRGHVKAGSKRVIDPFS